MASEDTSVTTPKNEEGTLLHVIDVLEGALGEIWSDSSNHKKISIVHHTKKNPGGKMMSDDRAAANVGANVDLMHGHHHGSDDDSYADTPNSRRHSSVSDGEEAEDMSVDAEENGVGEQQGQYNQTHALRQQLEDLASVDPEALRRQLHPVLEALDKLDAEATLGLERTNESWMGPVRLDDTAQVVPIHELITPRQYGQMAGCVRYLHITERLNCYSIGIFIFPPSARIPLHDHPNMAVLSRVLYGEVTARSFDLIPQSPTCKDDAVTNECGDESDHDQNQTANNTDLAMSDKQENDTNSSSTLSRSMLGRTGSWISSLLRRSSSAFSASVSSTTSSDPKTRPRGSKRAIMCHADRILKAPSTTVLLPREGNVHQFTAGPDGAAVLDVLLPPYDFDNERDCTFYKVEPDTSTNASTCKNKGSRGDDNCWLIPIEQPKDFHCISGTFGSVGVTE